MSEKTEFWKPEPIHPDDDPFVRFWLKGPIFVAAFGFFIGGIFAFSFDNINLIPENVRQGFAILGSALIVFGSELNTPGTFLEVFKKLGQGGINWWQFCLLDFPACFFSAVGTLFNLAVVFALSITASKTFESESIAWVEIVLTWGPLLALLGVSFDYIGSLIEWGLSFGLFNARKETWLEEKKVWEQEQKGIIGKPEVVDELRSELSAANKLLARMGKALDTATSKLGTLETALVRLRGDFDKRPKVKCTKVAYLKLLELANSHGPKSANIGEHKIFILANGYSLPTDEPLRKWIEAAGFEVEK